MNQQGKDRRYWGTYALGRRGSGLTVDDQFHSIESKAVDLKAGRFSQMGIRPFFFTIAWGRCNKPTHGRLVALSSSRRRRAATLIQFSRGLLSRSALSQAVRIEPGIPQPMAYPMHQRLSCSFGFNTDEHRREANGTILYSRGKVHEKHGARQHEFG